MELRPQTEDQPSLLLPADLADCALHLFDLVWIFIDNNNDDTKIPEDPRLAVVARISQLANYVSRQDSNLEDGGALLAIEESMRLAREAAELFLAGLADQRLSVNEACDELKQVSLQRKLPAWGSIADQLVAEFHEQSRKEERSTAQFLKCLDCFYTSREHSQSALGPNHRNSNAAVSPQFLEALQRCLRRADLQNNHVLRLAAELLQSRKNSAEFLLAGCPTLIRATNNPPESVSRAERSAFPSQDPTDVIDLVKLFLAKEDRSSCEVALLVGAEGTGKTFVCDQIERLAAHSRTTCSILRPQVPLDFLGSSVGEAEDLLIALFNAAYTRQEEKVIILLDDVDVLLPSSAATTHEASSSVEIESSSSHLTSRLQSTLMHILDTLQPTASDILLVCTSKNNLALDFPRYEFVFHVEPPTVEERKKLIAACLDLKEEASGLDSKISRLADSLVGRSFSEMSQFCSEAIAVVAAQDQEGLGRESAPQVLDALEMCVRRKSPLSLRSGVLGDFVDMQVYSGDDLLSSVRRNDASSREFPRMLYGRDIQKTWSDLVKNIVIPLCHRRELAELMMGEHPYPWPTANTMCGGILLSGEPGTGKTAISFEAARYAATLSPSISLIDVSCTSLIHKEVGGSERAVKKLFAAARKASPCILLMDGIENVAAMRGHDTTTEGSLDRVLSTLLVEMDGVEDSTTGQPEDSGVSGGLAIIGITRNEEWIDPALKRPGRLSKICRMGAPSEATRHEIIQREMASYLQQLTISQHDVDIHEISQALSLETAGMSGAAIAATCQQRLLGLQAM